MTNDEIRVLGHKKLVGYAKSFKENLMAETNTTSILEAFSKIKPYFTPSNFEEKGSRCICGHPIEVVFYVYNTVNNSYIKIGSECINKFERYLDLPTLQNEWKDYIEYSKAIIHIRQIVMDIFNHPEKIYTLRRRRSLSNELLDKAHIDLSFPKGFRDPYKPEELVKIDNFIFIKELAQLDIMQIDNVQEKLDKLSDSLKEEGNKAINNKMFWLAWDLFQKDNTVILDAIRQILSDRKEYRTTGKKSYYPKGSFGDKLKYVTSEKLNYLLYYNYNTKSLIF